ncbi:MAG: hypothetical protein AAF657_33380 [Acidobacteriota bacterium]
MKSEPLAGGAGSKSEPDAPVSSDRWQHLETLFEGALNLRGKERERFLSAACGEDGDLREELESLLDSHEAAGEFLEQPPVSESRPATVGAFRITGRLGEAVWVRCTSANAGRASSRPWR